MSDTEGLLNNVKSEKEDKASLHDMKASTCRATLLKRHDRHLVKAKRCQNKQLRFLFSEFPRTLFEDLSQMALDIHPQSVSALVVFPMAFQTRDLFVIRTSNFLSLFDETVGNNRRRDRAAES